MLKLTLFSLIFLMCLTRAHCSPLSQEKGDKKEVQVKRKEKREIEARKNFEKVYQMLYDSSFVVKVNYIYNGKSAVFVNDNLHFVMTHGDKFITNLTGNILVGHPETIWKITSYKLIRNEKCKSCVLNFSAYSKIGGSINVIIDVLRSRETTVRTGDFELDGTILSLKEAGDFTVYHK